MTYRSFYSKEPLLLGSESLTAECDWHIDSLLDWLAERAGNGARPVALSAAMRMVAETAAGNDSDSHKFWLRVREFRRAKDPQSVPSVVQIAEAAAKAAAQTRYIEVGSDDGNTHIVPNPFWERPPKLTLVEPPK